jgi:hypothetical protein
LDRPPDNGKHNPVPSLKPVADTPKGFLGWLDKTLEKL